MPVAAWAAVHAPRARTEDYFTAADIARSHGYSGSAYVLGFISLVVNLIVLGVLGLGRGARALGTWTKKAVRGHRWIQGIILAAVVVVVPTIVVLPAGIASWYHQRAYG